MKYIEDGNEMKFFAIEVNFFKDRTSDMRFYNLRTGVVFFKITKSNNGDLVEALEFFEDIKDELHKLSKTLDIEESYSYNKLILPLFREKRINDLLVK